MACHFLVVIGGSVLERGVEVADHAELGEDDRAFGVAVEPLDLAVDQLEDVAARCVPPLAGRPQRPGGKPQRAEGVPCRASCTTTMLPLT
jgi:hypothetical protein